MQDAGLVKYLYVQPDQQEWPMLQEMIDANKRLVSLTDYSMSTDEPWDMYM